MPDDAEMTHVEAAIDGAVDVVAVEKHVPANEDGAVARDVEDLANVGRPAARRVEDRVASDIDQTIEGRAFGLHAVGDRAGELGAEAVTQQDDARLRIAAADRVDFAPHPPCRGYLITGGVGEAERA